MLLKRRTSQNIVWGGAAGCMPVLIGWSAVTDSLSWAAVVLFAVIFFWTPPHFWALAMQVQGRLRPRRASRCSRSSPRPQVVARRVVAYSWAMVATSGAARARRHRPGLPGLRGLLGAVFLREAHVLERRVRAGAGVQPDAAVPLLDHLPRAAVPRRRGRPAASDDGSRSPPAPRGRSWTATVPSCSRRSPPRAWTSTSAPGTTPLSTGRPTTWSSCATTWDYWDRPEQFLAWARSVPRLANPPTSSPGTPTRPTCSGSRRPASPSCPPRGWPPATGSSCPGRRSS